MFEWCSTSSARRHSRCNRGPRVRMSTTMATQPSNPLGDSRMTPPVVMAASIAAHSFGKFPRGRGRRASWSRRDCICWEEHGSVCTLVSLPGSWFLQLQLCASLFPFRCRFLTPHLIPVSAPGSKLHFQLPGESRLSLLNKPGFMEAEL